MTGFLAATRVLAQPSALFVAGTVLISFTAALLAGVQTFLRPTERAIQHWQASTRYAEVRRRIELLGDCSEPSMRETLKEINDELGKLGENSPLVPEAIYQKAKAAADAEAV
jgi:hypothetical protein